MGATFNLNHEQLAADERFAVLARELGQQSRIDSSASFNRYCREACRLWKEQFGQGIGATAAKFAELLQRVEEGGEGVIPTSWGGVVVTLHGHPRVEKYLVIREGGYLALEKHELKDEHLEVQEGAGLLLWRSAPDEVLTVEALLPGSQFHFEPGREHCMIGTKDLLVFERSTDSKGMDQDLIFLYEPDSNS